VTASLHSSFVVTVWHGRYAHLSDLSFLEQPGYVAGVTNPMFETREEWWDLLCVLDLPQVGGVWSGTKKV
jgi:hypothetical protein